MAINKNKVVTFNDLENYAGISVDPSLNLSINKVNNISLLNLFYFKGFVNVSVNEYAETLKYAYFGYIPITNYYEISEGFRLTTNNNIDIDIPMPVCHTQSKTYYVVLSSAEQYFENVRAYFISQEFSSYIEYSQIATFSNDDTVNDIWTEYKPIIDPSTGEPMKDENGNILYEEGEYYAETRKRGEPISL